MFGDELVNENSAAAEVPSIQDVAHLRTQPALCQRTSPAERALKKLATCYVARLAAERRGIMPALVYTGTPEEPVPAACNADSLCDELKEDLRSSFWDSFCAARGGAVTFSGEVTYNWLWFHSGFGTWFIFTVFDNCDRTIILYWNSLLSVRQFPRA